MTLQNFRSCLDTAVDLDGHLTVLVGENDAGKSNVIDAIRAATPPASGRRTFWFDHERDVTYDAEPGAGISIRLEYDDLTPGEESLFLPVLTDSDGKLIHNTAFAPQPNLPRRLWVSRSVGSAEVSDPEPDNRERIAHVYLPPLRDAMTTLDSARSERLADIFRWLASEEEIDSFRTVANDALTSLGKQDAARKVVQGVQRHLTSVTRPVRHRLVALRHQDQELRSLIRSLRVHMAGAGLDPSDLAHSGLGYANLLYIATVVLELERAPEYDLVLMLVEEPEAHLHPQLQSVLLSYLEEQARLTAQVAAGRTGNSGRIQVVVTTHSPNLPSSISTSRVVVLRATSEKPDGRGAGPRSDLDATEDTSTVGYPRTRAVALREVALSSAERRKVDRYLDTTGASLLFARQVVLVEGIAEAILLRTLAERVVLSERRVETDEDDAEAIARRREQFRAITILPVGGVDFSPYLMLLLGTSVPLVDRVVVMTDGDDGAGKQRKEALHKAFEDHVDDGVLVVEVGDTTLEADLYALSQNEAVLETAFAAQHPRSLKKWRAISPSDASVAERAERFASALRERTLDLAKGDFAHTIAELLEPQSACVRDEPPPEDADVGTHPDFAVPAYVERMIRAVLIDGDQ